MMVPTVGVVVPAYRPDVAALTSFVRDLDTLLAPATVRIELDAPGEPGLVDDLEALPAAVNTVPHRRGKGAAITAGFEALDTDVLAFADADGATPANSVAAVIEPVTEGRAALSVGSRRHPDADVIAHQSVVRRRLGDHFAWLARRVLDVALTDFQCGAKALTREGWNDVRAGLYEPGFAWDVELIGMASARGLAIEEVPVTWHDQPGSTVPPTRSVLSFSRTLYRVRRRSRLAGPNVHETPGVRRRKRRSLVEQLAEPVDD